MGRIIREMYATYISLSMRTGRVRTYNAAMASIAVRWQKLQDFPSTYVLDGALAAALAVLILFQTGLDLLPLIVLATLPLVWRRKQPLLVYCLVFVGAIGLAHDSDWPAITCIGVAAYSVGVYERQRSISLGILVACALFVDYEFGGGLPRIPDATGPFLILLPLRLMGSAIRSWRQRVEVLKEHAALGEQARAKQMQVALTEERARIARELHDVIAHSVSVMVVQAGAARQVLNSSPEAATEALLAVESTGRAAMTELRGMLGLLDHGEIALSPQPGLEQIQPLVQQVADAGLPVQLTIKGEPKPLTAGIDITAYRIVQEALTNALKYSGLAPTEVVLEFRDDEVKLQVLDDGMRAAAETREKKGRGLIGMRERVALYGGTLDAGPRPERGYAVRAWLPLSENGR